MGRPKLEGKWKKLYRGPWIWVEPQAVEASRKWKLRKAAEKAAALEAKAKADAESLGGKEDTKETKPLSAKLTAQDIYDNF